MPCSGVKPIHVVKPCGADLEFIPGIGIEGPVVVENVNEWKVMTGSNFIIISVVCGGNLYSSCAEFHVDDNRVGDDREPAINERVDSEFSVKML